MTGDGQSCGFTFSERNSPFFSNAFRRKRIQRIKPVISKTSSRVYSVMYKGFMYCQQPEGSS